MLCSTGNPYLLFKTGKGIPDFTQKKVTQKRTGSWMEKPLQP
jgi:hypothetical protein